MVTFLALFFVFYLWHGMGITIGYHRLLAHRAFRCEKPFEYFWVIGGYLAFQGSPIWWAAIHRAHHRYSDTNLDPHTPKKGLKYALFGWLFDNSYLPQLNLAVHCKDLIKNDFYRRLEPRGNIAYANVLNLALNVVYRLLLLWLFGWTVFLANLVASIGVFMIPQLLNVACHLPKLGYKNFPTDDDGVNVWWVGILALGEGWHNNHHAFPGSSRTGLLPHEIDLSWQMIRAAKFCGLVTDANDPKEAMSCSAEKARHSSAIEKTRHSSAREETRHNTHTAR